MRKEDVDKILKRAVEKDSYDCYEFILIHLYNSEFSFQFEIRNVTFNFYPKLLMIKDSAENKRLKIFLPYEEIKMIVIK